MPARIVAAVVAAGAAAFGIAFAAGKGTGEDPGPPPAFGAPAIPLDLAKPAATAKPVSLGSAAKLPALARRKPPKKAPAPAPAAANRFASEATAGSTAM